MSDQPPLSDDIARLVGVSTERVLASPPWGIEMEGLRVFTNAIMDPDPRYWDAEFAKQTKYGEIVTPPIYCSYLWLKTPAGSDDPVSAAFRENPNSDGIGGVSYQGSIAALPPIPTDLKRILNAGNEIEVLQYPQLGDRVYSQARYAEFKMSVTKQNAPMMLVKIETIYTNQDNAVLCILRSSRIYR